MTVTPNGWRTWMLGILITLVLALASIAWSSHEYRLATIEQAVAAQVPRVAVLESRLGEIQRSLDRIERTLAGSGVAGRPGPRPPD